MTTATGTQTEQILEYLQTRGPITALDALDEFGCFRLAARINDLKNQGHNIESASTTTPKGATIARYTLIDPAQGSLF